MADYTETLSLQGFPEIKLAPKEADYEKFAAAAAGLAEEMSAVYMGSYGDAKADYGVIYEELERRIGEAIDDGGAWAAAAGGFEGEAAAWTGAAEAWRTGAGGHSAELGLIAAELDAYAGQTEGIGRQMQDALLPRLAGICPDFDAAAFRAGLEGIGTKLDEALKAGNLSQAAFDNIGNAIIPAILNMVPDPDADPESDAATDFDQIQKGLEDLKTALAGAAGHGGILTAVDALIASPAFSGPCVCTAAAPCTGGCDTQGGAVCSGCSGGAACNAAGAGCDAGCTAAGACPDLASVQDGLIAIQAAIKANQADEAVLQQAIGAANALLGSLPDPGLLAFQGELAAFGEGLAAALPAAQGIAGRLEAAGLGIGGLDAPSEAPAMAPAAFDAFLAKTEAVKEAAGSYDPLRYLTAGHQSKVGAIISEYDAGLANAQAEIGLSQAENLEQISGAYLSYSEYAAGVTASVIDAYNAGNRDVDALVGAFLAAKARTSQSNQALIGEFAGKMQNSRANATVNQKVVEFVSNPVALNHVGIRPAEAKTTGYNDIPFYGAGAALLLLLAVSLLMRFRGRKKGGRDETGNAQRR
jgi:hypothetical protein